MIEHMSKGGSGQVVGTASSTGERRQVSPAGAAERRTLGEPGQCPTLTQYAANYE